MLPHKDTDHLKDFLNTLVNEVISEECQLIARIAGREMATELLEKMAIYDVIMDMVTEEMLQTGDYIVGFTVSSLLGINLECMHKLLSINTACVTPRRGLCCNNVYYEMRNRILMA